MSKFFILFHLVILSSSFINGSIERISMDIEAKRVYKGKSLTSIGTVYFDSQIGLMVSRFLTPQEQIVISTASGEFKNYDVNRNTVSMSQGIDYSSRNSFIFYCLAGKTQDMGLPGLGFVQQGTKIKDGLLVSTWVPKLLDHSEITKVELVHEMMRPIYMGFYNKENRLFSKVYYYNFTKVQNITFPQVITEIEYLSPLDSVVTKKTYSNYKVNNQVEMTYLNYKIPANAKVVDLDKQK